MQPSRTIKPRHHRMDDERLARLAGAGDATAFEALYDRHHAPLLAFCRHMLGNREDGEDALQQAFVRAHKALAGGRAPDRVRPWLYAIARNRCLTLIAARREAAVPADDLEPSFDGLAADVERRADLRELVADLGRLPDDQRAALVLAELGDLGHGDIARVIGCPPAKVKALVFQARTALIAERDARRTPCDEIRAQLETARGRRPAPRRPAQAPAPVRSLRGVPRRGRAAAGRASRSCSRSRRARASSWRCWWARAAWARGAEAAAAAASLAAGGAGRRRRRCRRCGFGGGRRRRLGRRGGRRGLGGRRQGPRGQGRRRRGARRGRRRGRAGDRPRRAGRVGRVRAGRARGGAGGRPVRGADARALDAVGADRRARRRGGDRGQRARNRGRRVRRGERRLLAGGRRSARGRRAAREARARRGRRAATPSPSAASAIACARPIRRSPAASAAA